MKLLATGWVVGAIGVTALVGCSTSELRAPAAAVMMPSSCLPEKTVQISQITPPSGSASATITVNPGQRHVDKLPKAGIRWSLPGPPGRYAFTSTGVTFSASPPGVSASTPPGGSGAPANGGSDYTWCIDSGGPDATWYYTIQFTVSPPAPAPATTWTCDPTIVNYGSSLLTDPKVLNCTVR